MLRAAPTARVEPLTALLRRPAARAAAVIVALALCFTPGAGADDTELPAEADARFFEANVRPILVAHCHECHGADKQQAGLRLDSRAAVLAGGDSGPAVVPSQPDGSLLVTAIHYGDGPQMPPKGKLEAVQIAALTEWVRRGAAWPEAAVEPRSAADPQGFQITPEDRQFWSFRPIGDPPPPAVHDSSWPWSELDFFVLAKLEEAGLAPSPPADKRALLRRVTFNLTGLPPSPEEIDSFLADDSPEALDRVVDRLLGSPHYGERWARHWLDVARYGEDQAHTFEARKYPQGYRYRDWLIRAFNDDLPYDRFIMEQIAADLLDAPDRLKNLPALGYFALGPVYYGDPKKLDQIDDRIDTLSRGFLGLTVACARCHDHKYDPISSEDYYALAGVFASSEQVDVPLVSDEDVKAADSTLGEEEKKRRNRPKKYPHIHALRDAAEPVAMRVHLRGNPDTLGDEAPRRFPSILAGEGPHFSQGSGRLELARAIADKGNPLTARVLVNRVWKHHFGKGLVRSSGNFGALGEPPTHPELLDYLATRFMESGWSLKNLHREILLSATFRQASRFDQRSWEIDPDNRLLWRMNRRRLDVESWRDAMLAAGALDRKIGGPSGDLASPENCRRTLYGAVSRHDLDPLLRLFDFPDPNITSDERSVTTVPLQQLFVLNSEFMVKSAQALAARLRAGHDDEAARIRQAYLLAFGRPATGEEMRWGLEFLGRDEPADRAGANGGPANGGPANGRMSRWARYAQTLLGANEFMFID